MSRYNFRDLRYATADVETTFVKREDGSSDNRPYNPLNSLTSIGIKPRDKEIVYTAVDHSTEPMLAGTKPLIQGVLDETQLLIGHNIKFDLTWLRECGYIYEGDIWDTMLVEKLISGGRLHANELGLSDCCEREGIAVKTDEVRGYWDRGYATDKIPWPILKQYGINDVLITEQLFLTQLRRLDYDV